MGTRGLKIIRFRGKYFVYFNRYDSYPQGLGLDLVSAIPIDPENYKAWLESERGHYAELTAELESEVLTVTEDKMRDLVNGKCAQSYRGSGGELLWKKVDYRLEELPSALCNVGIDLMIECVYILDLDNELFSINNWLFFDLWNIPRERWIQVFECNNEGRKTNPLETCPEGSFGVESKGYFTDDTADERNRYHGIYQQYINQAVEANSNIDVLCPASLQQFISLLLFEELTVPYASHFWKHVSAWGHEDFAFREIAFAILSIAAGQYYFDNPSRFESSHDSNGYLVDRNNGSEPKLMPVFGSACHTPDQEPGSAPTTHIYWFENVLVSLVPNTVFETDTEAAIAKAVEYGLEEGESDFQIVIFSILNAVMLEVQVKDGVKKIRRTGVVSIYHAVRTNDGDKSDDQEEKDKAATVLEEFCRKHSGFIALQNFFNVAANRHLGAFGKGRFPTEIYAAIIGNTDRLTRNACAKVSGCFRGLRRECFPFSDGLTILNFTASRYFLARQERSQLRPRLHLNDIGIFAFQDWETGQVLRSELNVEQHAFIVKERKVTNWCPVFGGMARPSMMTQFPLRLFLRP